MMHKQVTLINVVQSNDLLSQSQTLKRRADDFEQNRSYRLSLHSFITFDAHFYTGGLKIDCTWW